MPRDPCPVLSRPPLVGSVSTLHSANDTTRFLKRRYRTNHGASRMVVNELDALHHDRERAGQLHGDATEHVIDATPAVPSVCQDGQLQPVRQWTEWTRN